MSSQSQQKELPKLSEDKAIGKSERLIPETVGDSVGCKHEFVLKGYEAVCTKCPIGLFVHSYQDYLDLTKKMELLK